MIAMLQYWKSVISTEIPSIRVVNLRQFNLNMNVATDIWYIYVWIARQHTNAGWSRLAEILIAMKLSVFTQQFTYANKIHIASFKQKFSADHLNQHGSLLQLHTDTSATCQTANACIDILWNWNSKLPQRRRQQQMMCACVSLSLSWHHFVSFAFFNAQIVLSCSIQYRWNSIHLSMNDIRCRFTFIVSFVYRHTTRYIGIDWKRHTGSRIWACYVSVDFKHIKNILWLENEHHLSAIFKTILVSRSSFVFFHWPHEITLFSFTSLYAHTHTCCRFRFLRRCEWSFPSEIVNTNASVVLFWILKFTDIMKSENGADIDNKYARKKRRRENSIMQTSLRCKLLCVTHTDCGEWKV